MYNLWSTGVIFFLDSDELTFLIMIKQICITLVKEKVYNELVFFILKIVQYTIYIIYCRVHISYCLTNFHSTRHFLGL